MNLTALKSFAPAMRRQLIEAVTRKLDTALTGDTADLRAARRQVDALRREAMKDRDGLIERVAYTWFNRLAALRFLDAKGWHPFRARVLTPTSSEETQPEILKLFRNGELHADLRPHIAAQRLNDLLDGRLPSADPLREVYRALVLAACHYYHAQMPFLFEALDDETELLLPDDLLSEMSVAQGFRDAIRDEDCAEVEVLGWLYQFYISEKKDAVMARKRAVPSEDIPAVTQLFTPHWIVRYLVENALGRLWLQSRPASRLRDHMPYYVEEVASDQWLVTSHSPLATDKEDHHGSQRLQGTDRVAEGDATGGGNLHSQQDHAEGRALRPDQPDATGDRVGAVEHRGGAGAQVDGGVQAFPLHQPGLFGRTGDATAAGATAGDAAGRTHDDRRQPDRGSEQDASGASGEAGLVESDQWLVTSPSPLVTSPSPLVTSHSPLVTSHSPLVTNLQDIRLIDPACGSGHMLTYAFDLLFKMYEEEGYAPADIPALILQHNLHGLEICPRAAQLAQFALLCKARQHTRKAFTEPTQPQVLCLQDVAVTDEEMRAWAKAMGNALTPAERAQAVAQVAQFAQHTRTFGALIQPVLRGDEIAALQVKVGADAPAGDLIVQVAHDKVRLALRQAELLTQRYHVVVANPPYMGGKQMNPAIKEVAAEQYPDSKADLFAMFIERGFQLVVPCGWSAMVTMQSWMFLSSYEVLREKLLEEKTIYSMVHMANMVMGIAFGTAATVWKNERSTSHKGQYSYVAYEDLTESNQPFEFPVKNARLKSASANDFKKIPGSPIAYWVSSKLLKKFTESKQLYEFSISDGQNITADNGKYVRFHWEVESQKVGVNRGKWVFYAKGGQYRKWYGNLEYVVDWSDKARSHYRAHPSARVIPEYLWFKEGVTWTLITSSKQSFRFLPSTATFDKGGSSIFFRDAKTLKKTLLFLNTCISDYLLKMFNTTLNLQVDDVRKLPLSPTDINIASEFVDELIQIARNDWNNFETSWDFRDLPLLRSGEWRVESGQKEVTSDQWLVESGQAEEVASDEWLVASHSPLVTSHSPLKGDTLEASWNNWAAYLRENIATMQRLETENNRLWIAAYGLQDELTPEVPEDEITLARPERRKDMAAFLSYAVGCMMGRYALSTPGLILADAGATLDDYWRKVNSGEWLVASNSPLSTSNSPLSTSHFTPDADGLIPILDGEWFDDDIVARAREFLRVTFGPATLAQNIAFIEESLGKDLRSYFSTQFYKDHLQTYKKRPIYWLFRSPKGGFACLMYLHRYTKDTVNGVLNRYLREFIGKLEARIAQLDLALTLEGAPARDKTRMSKEREQMRRTLRECQDWERDVLLPLALRRIEIDLDDGVKVNYLKLGPALAPIPGLGAKEE